MTDGVREVRAGRLDVADRAAFTTYAEETARAFGRVNVVINNAGVSLSGDLLDLSWEDIDWITGINLGGVVHGTKLFLPHLIASGEGHVVNISSLFGLVSMPGQSMYNAAKYAVRGMTEALREEMLVAGHPVGVTAVHPGGIRTGIARNGRVVGRRRAARPPGCRLRRQAGPYQPREGRHDHPRRRAQGPGPACSSAPTRTCCTTSPGSAGRATRTSWRGSTRASPASVPSAAEPAGPGGGPLEPGAPVSVAMTKWREHPHWGFAARWLGHDEHGGWIGVPAGTPYARPGAAFDAAVDSVTLVPHDGAWLATHHAPGIWCDLYVDMATPAVWDSATLRSVDLDLDVVRRVDGSVYVDDEDELAEHRVSLGYPDALVAQAERACAEVLAAVSAGTAPFDPGTASRWLARLRDLSRG